MRVGDEVVSSHALHDAGRSDIEAAVVGDRLELGGRDGGVLGIGLEDRVGHALANLEAHGLGLRKAISDAQAEDRKSMPGTAIWKRSQAHLGGDGSNYTATLLTADEGQITLVQATTVVGVDEVDACKLVLDKNLTVGDGGDRPGFLNL